MWNRINSPDIQKHYMIRSPFPIYLCCDHKPILYLWGCKGQLSHRFFRYQVIITKFQNLKVIWTPGSNFVFPDILSRNITIEENQNHQLQHKRIPRDIWSHTKFNMKTTLMIPTRTSTQKITNVATKKNTEITKQRRGHYRQ